VYKAANGRLPKAVDALRAKYAACTEATITVFGMSGTPELGCSGGSSDQCATTQSECVVSH
jgi:hypothetical protein